MTLAPTDIGGPATYVVVRGISMEPQLRTGDLTVANKSSAYRLGDLVVFHLADERGGPRGSVIHRLVAGSAREGWKTQGDNNDWIDPWTVENEQIAGRYWFKVAGAGSVFTWVSKHELGAGAICAGLVVVTSVPRRRRRISPLLRKTLAAATREPRRVGRPALEYAVLGVSCLGALMALAVVGGLGTTHQLRSVDGALAALALAWAGGATWYLLERLFDGRGLPEPARSSYALSGRVWRVAEFPILDAPVLAVASAVALRELAESYRVPILHRVDPDTGRHEYLLVTVQKGAYAWSPPEVARHRRARHAA